MVKHSAESYKCGKINRCDFDLCSDCAMKNTKMGRNNECVKGHQLYPISVNADGWRWRGWNCNGVTYVGCRYNWSPGQELDQDVEVWRCEHDLRKMSTCPYTGTTIINKIPWGDGWVWSPQEADQEGGGMMEVRYDVVRDSYFTTNTEGGDREGWWRGVWRWENIQRRDYSRRDEVDLAREYGGEGLIEWRVKVREGEMITRVVLRVESTVSNKGSVRWELSGGDISLTVSPGTELDTNQLAGANQISLQATLLGRSYNDSKLFRSPRTEEKQLNTQLKLLVYFARSGTDQDQQEDRQTEKTKKSDKEGEAGDTQEGDREEEIIDEPAAQEVEENVEMALKEEDEREAEKSDTISQALSDLQSQIRELREKLTDLEEETGREINKLRREVETLKSENKGEGKAGANKEVQTEERGREN